MPGELASRLQPIVAEAVTAAGFDLDSFEVQQAGRRQLVKVVVDSDDESARSWRHRLAEYSKNVLGSSLTTARVLPVAGSISITR